MLRREFARASALALVLFASPALSLALAPTLPLGRVGRALPAGRLNPRAALPHAAVQSVSLVKTPKETYEALVEKGVANSKMSVAKTLVSSTMGGCFVGMAGLLSMAIAGGMPQVAATNPGLVKLMFAALFPVNLLLVLQTGGQLFTGNTATMSAALIEGKVTGRQLAKNWATSYVGNVLGCGLIALATAYCGLLASGTASLAAATVVKKCSASFGQTVVKAVLCNWLVCLAVFLATSASDLTGKMVGIWFPISTFVGIGFEHSVANMFLLPLGLLAAAPLTLKGVLLLNLLPVTLGNLLAGVLAIGVTMSFLHGKLGERS